MYNLIVRPLLFLIDPEKVHRMLLNWLKIYRYLLPVRACVRGHYQVDEPFSYGSLRFKNRIGLSAGFDKNAETFDELADFGFGFLEVGTVTPDYQPGNPSPRIFSLVEDEALNSRTGFNNSAVDGALEHIRRHRKHSYILGVNINTLRYQVPGGMLSNLISQLKEQGKEDKYEEVLAEVPRVRKDLGEPPLVTPSSQIVGTQAVFNVLMGERYKVATKETKDILLGKYGQTVKPFNPEVVDKVLGDEKKNAITCRPADLLEPELDKIEAEMKQYKQQDEDVLSYALFPQVATDFFKYREAQQTGVDAKTADTKNGAYPV